MVVVVVVVVVVLIVVVVIMVVVVVIIVIMIIVVVVMIIVVMIIVIVVVLMLVFFDKDGIRSGFAGCISIALNSDRSGVGDTWDGIIRQIASHFDRGQQATSSDR